MITTTETTGYGAG
ncbi:thr operon leader peptide [Yersinia enterocolitica]|nr:thr operon leader peptide [Yersinia enterocolitica]